MTESIESLLARHDNDATEAEAAFRATTGLELIRAPVESMRVPAELNTSVSVVIAAWNAGATLPACLTALERSTVNRAASHLLEVVVIDDGSADATWHLLQNLPLSLNLKALRTPHGHSRAQAQNSAVAHAEGDIVISCDADVVLAPFALEEFVRRLQVCPHLLLLGFYVDIAPTSPALAVDEIETRLFASQPQIERDWRRGNTVTGWPEHPVRDSAHLGRLSRGRAIHDARGMGWDAPHMVYGGLFAMTRAAFLAIGGYDERFVGWGSEDTFLGAKALVHGLKIVPTYSASGWHIAHPPRGSRKREEAEANRLRYQAALLEHWRPPSDDSWLSKAAARVETGFRRAASTSPPPADRGALFAPYQAIFDDPRTRGAYLRSVGRFEEAATSYASATGTPTQRARAAAERGRALWAAGHTRRAIELWTPLATDRPPTARLLVELAMATAEVGEIAAGRSWLDRAAAINAEDALLRFVLRRSSAEHLQRGDLQAANHHDQLALRDYTAAWLVDPSNHEARVKCAAASGGRLPIAAAARDAAI